jgi:DNA-binding NtrC family response regulator
MSTPHPHTIMVVDDNPTVRGLLCHILLRENFRILKARQSQEALFFSEEFPGTIDLLLTDLRLGNFPNGRVLAQKLRMSRPAIRVMYLSGCVDDDLLQEEVNDGSAIFLAKPFTVDALLSGVRSCLEVPEPVL